MIKQKGFTFVELLVVVAIIGVLAAIAIPQYTKYKLRGYVATLQSDLQNAYTAAQAYFTDAPGITITDESLLLRKGFKKSSDVAVVSLNLAAGKGSIVLSHKGLNTNNASSNQGSIDYSGNVDTPQLK